jgi:hypothetical protein
MFRYRVEIASLPTRYYDLTLGNLQGIYTFIALSNKEELQDLVKNLQIVKENDVSLFFERLRSRFPNIVSYDEAMRQPLLDMSPVNGSAVHPMNFPSRSPIIEFSRSSTVICVSERCSGTSFEVSTVNVSDYFAGLLLMSQLQQLALSDKSLTTFQIIDTKNPKNYELLSLLSGFELSLLPVELTSQILSYYPADWYLVSKDFYQLVHGDLINDERVRYESRMRGALRMIEEFDSLSRHQIRSLLELINSNKSNFLSLYPLVKVMNKGMELLMKAITDKILKADSLSDYINKYDVIADSTVPYFKWLFENYDDAYYVIDEFKIINYRLNKIATLDPGAKFTYLFLNRIAPSREFSTILFSKVGDIGGEDLYKLTVDIISSNGVITKSATNPLTGKTREGYLGKTINININEYMNDLLTYVERCCKKKKYPSRQFKDTILYLVKNFGGIHLVVRWKILEMFVYFSSSTQDSFEIIEYLNFALPFIESMEEFDLVLKLLLDILDRAMKFRPLKEESEAIIALLEEILIRQEYFKYQSSKSSTRRILQILTITVENLKEGELRNRYQCLINHIIATYPEAKDIKIVSSEEIAIMLKELMDSISNS